MGKVRRGPTTQSVSPYLKRPLRTLANVLASRKSLEKKAARAIRSYTGAKVQPCLPGSAVTSSTAD